MSSLVRNVGTIGALTAVSRVFGFARDMLLARVLGAGLAADAWQLAFILPNTFRRLFAEGAFSVAFVPMYTRALHGDGGEEAADSFAGDGGDAGNRLAARARVPGRARQVRTRGQPVADNLSLPDAGQPRGDAVGP